MKVIAEHEQAANISVRLMLNITNFIVCMRKLNLSKKKKKLGSTYIFIDCYLDQMTSLKQ